MEQTPLRGNNLIGVCTSKDVLETLYEECKEKCEVLKDELTELI